MKRRSSFHLVKTYCSLWRKANRSRLTAFVLGVDWIMRFETVGAQIKPNSFSIRPRWLLILFLKHEIVDTVCNDYVNSK
jgi:hypothetical protein